MSQALWLPLLLVKRINKRGKPPFPLLQLLLPVLLRVL